MAVFDEDKLREEEIKSGFTPETPDDDSFLLERMDNYPGEIQFTDSPEFISEEEPVESQESLSIDEIIRQSDLSIESEEKQNIAEISQTINEPQTSIPDEPVIKDFDMYEEELNDTSEEATEFDVSSKEDISEFKFEQPEPIETEIEPKQEETIVIDDELKALIQTELQKSKSKQPSEQTPEEPIEIKPFEIDDPELSQDAQIINISELDAERPSTYFPREKTVETEDDKQTSTPKMDISKPAKEPVVKPDDSGEIKEKKLRKPFPWKLMIIPAAAFLILVIIGSLSYILLFDEHSDFYLFKQSSDTLATQKTKIDTPKKAITQKEPKQIDTQKIQPKTEIKEIETTKTKIDTLKPKIAQKPKEKEPEKAIAIEKPKKEKIETKKPDYAYKPIDKPVVPIQQTKIEIYTVQVYASPSKEDAEEWLERLKAMNIENAFISTQKIRDRIWYRVRFGNFNTREEARSMALKYGFAQSWIDRVQ